MESEIKTKSGLASKSQGQGQINRTLKYEHSDKGYLPESEHSAASTSHKGRLYKSICYLEYVGEGVLISFLFCASPGFANMNREASQE